MTDWSFVLIPDTQHLATPANGWTGYFDGLRDWIIDHQVDLNIQLVAGLGDIVHEFGDAGSWANAETALLPLFDLDIPVLLFPSGNHDTDTIDQTTRNLTAYNNSFPPSLYEGKDWFGGVYEAGRAENMWVQFTIGDYDYLAFGLEFYPRENVLDWVREVAGEQPDARVLISTHAYLYPDGTRDTWETPQYGPADYFTEGVDDARSGEQMWADFRRIPGLFAVVNGHYIYDNVAYSIDTGDAGNRVLQGFYNWQEYGLGGRGRVVLMTVNPTLGTIRQDVYRTDLDSVELGNSNEFLYTYTHNVLPSEPPALESGYYAVDRGDGLEGWDYGSGPEVLLIP